MVISQPIEWGISIAQLYSHQSTFGKIIPSSYVIIFMEKRSFINPLYLGPGVRLAPYSSTHGCISQLHFGPNHRQRTSIYGFSPINEWKQKHMMEFYFSIRAARMIHIHINARCRCFQFSAQVQFMNTLQFSAIKNNGGGKILFIK